MSVLDLVLSALLALVWVTLAVMVVLFVVRGLVVAAKHSWMRRELKRLSTILIRNRDLADFSRLKQQIGHPADPDLLDAAIRRVFGEEFDLLAPELRARIVRVYDAWGVLERHRARLQFSRYWRERADSAIVLARLGDVQAIPLLTAALRDPYEDASTVKGAVGRALGLFGAPGAAEALVDELHHLNEWSSPRLAEVLVEMGSDAVEPLVAALDSQSINLRVWAARILGRIRDRRGVSPLTELLDDPAPEVRRAVVEALGWLGDTHAVPAVASTLLRDPTPRVRTAAAAALGRLRHPDAVEALLHALGDADHWTRLSVADAIETLGLREPDRLIDIARDPDPARAEGAVRVLARLGFVDTWLKVLVDGSDDSAAAAAEEWLAVVVAGGETQAITDLLRSRPEPAVRRRLLRLLPAARDPEARRAVADATSDPGWDVRIDALHVYAQMAPGDIQPILARLDDSEEAVRLAALRALRAAAPPLDGAAGLSAILERLARSPKPAIRSAVLACLEDGDRAPLNAVRELTSDTDPDLRGRAAVLLARLVGPEAVETLLPLLEDPAPQVRSLVARAIGDVGDRTAIEALVRATWTAPPSVREALTSAIAGRGFDEVSSLLPLFAASGSAEGRIATAWTLGKTGDARAIPKLEGLLDSDDARLRASAAGALGRCPGRAAVAALRRALTDPDPHVRAAGVNALGIVGEPTDIGLLHALVDDPDPYVGRRALIGIGRLGSDHGRTMLEDALWAEVHGAAAAVGLAALGTLDAVRSLSAWAAAGEGRLGRVIEAIDGEREDDARRLRADLGHLPAEPATEAIRRWAGRLQEQLILAPEPLDRLGAVELLRCWDDGRPLTWLGPLVRSDPSETVRARAVELVNPREPGALAVFAAALRDGNKNVRRATVIRLAEVKAPRSDLRSGIGDDLLACADLAGPELGRRCRRALACMFDFDPEGLGGLERRATTFTGRQLCIRALGDVQHPAAEGELLRLLLDLDPRARRAAVAALAERGSPGVAGALRSALQDEDETVRSAAAAALRTVSRTAHLGPADRRTEPGNSSF